jgi:hypothetical protein
MLDKRTKFHWGAEDTILATRPNSYLKRANNMRPPESHVTLQFMNIWEASSISGARARYITGRAFSARIRRFHTHLPFRLHLTEWGGMMFGANNKVYKNKNVIYVPLFSLTFEFSNSGKGHGNQVFQVRSNCKFLVNMSNTLWSSNTHGKF